MAQGSFDPNFFLFYFQVQNFFLYPKNQLHIYIFFKSSEIQKKSIAGAGGSKLVERGGGWGVVWRSGHRTRIAHIRPLYSPHPIFTLCLYTPGRPKNTQCFFQAMPGSKINFISICRQRANFQFSHFDLIPTTGSIPNFLP